MKHKIRTYPPFLSTRSLNTSPARHKATSDHVLPSTVYLVLQWPVLLQLLHSVKQQAARKKGVPALPRASVAAWRRTIALLECRDPAASPSSRRCQGARPVAQPKLSDSLSRPGLLFLLLLCAGHGHGQQGVAATSPFGDGIDKARCHDMGHVVSDDIPCFCHDKCLGPRKTYTPVFRLPEPPTPSRSCMP